MVCFSIIFCEIKSSCFVSIVMSRSFKCPIVGTVDPMSRSMLLQKLDVLREYLFRRFCSGVVNANTNHNCKSEIVAATVDQVLEIYEYCSVITRDDAGNYTNCLAKTSLIRNLNKLIEQSNSKLRAMA